MNLKENVTEGGRRAFEIGVGMTYSIYRARVLSFHRNGENLVQ